MTLRLARIASRACAPRGAGLTGSTCSLRSYRNDSRSRPRGDTPAEQPLGRRTQRPALAGWTSVNENLSVVDSRCETLFRDTEKCWPPPCLQPRVLPKCARNVYAEIPHISPPRLQARAQQLCQSLALAADRSVRSQSLPLPPPEFRRTRCECGAPPGAPCGSAQMYPSQHPALSRRSRFPLPASAIVSPQ